MKLILSLFVFVVFLNPGISKADDFNGDGMGDYVWHNYANGDVALWLMNGPNISTTCIIGSVSIDDWVIVLVEDMDGDGLSDLTWNNQDDNSIAIWFMNACQVTNIHIVGAAGPNWVIMPSP